MDIGGIAGMDHRSVPLEVLRDFARSQAELSSIRLVAEDAGVSRSAVHKFISAGTMPHPRVRRLLALWYLRRLEGVDEIALVRPYVAALTVLFQDVPEPSRGRVTIEVLNSIEQGCTSVAEQPPRWLEVLRTRLARKGMILESNSFMVQDAAEMGKLLEDLARSVDRSSDKLVG